MTGGDTAVAVAIGNSGRPELAEVFDEPPGGEADSPSKQDAIVREHVEWAKRRPREDR